VRASRGRLRASTNFPGDVLEQWSFGFYHLFFGYLSRAGLDEDEDEDVIVPLGMVPIMTMHQAKGLQFPFVFVGHIVDAPNDLRDRPFWTHFAYLFSPQQWQQTWKYLPSKWNMTAALVKLFNRIVKSLRWWRVSHLCQYPATQTRFKLMGDGHVCAFTLAVLLRSGNWSMLSRHDVL
jgi:hypothetical protein